MHNWTVILYIFSKIVTFFLSGSATGHSLAVSVRRDLATLSSILLASHISSPCPDANGGIDLLAIRSSDCLTLRLPRAN